MTQLSDILKPVRFVMDDTNRKILAALKEDAKIPYTHLAKELGVPDTTIHWRVQRMKQAGVIKRFTIEVDEVVEMRATSNLIDFLDKKFAEQRTEVDDLWIGVKACIRKLNSLEERINHREQGKE